MWRQMRSLCFKSLRGSILFDWPSSRDVSTVTWKQTNHPQLGLRIRSYWSSVGEADGEVFKTGALLWLCQHCPNSSSSYETQHDKSLQLGAKWDGVKSMVCFSEMLWLDRPKTSVCDNWGIRLLTHRIFNPFKGSHSYSWRIFKSLFLFSL